MKYIDIDRQEIYRKDRQKDGQIDRQKCIDEKPKVSNKDVIIQDDFDWRVPFCLPCHIKPYDLQENEETLFKR